jgi:Zn-dependent protease
LSNGHAATLGHPGAGAAPPSPRRAPSFRWSWRVGRIAGIDVRIHATFLVLLAWIGIAHLLTGDWRTALEGMGLVVCTFGAIVIHELSHALVARRFGIPTHDITLLPIGGVSTLERMPDRPIEELLVAAVGPFTNFVIALVLFGVLLLMGKPIFPEDFAVIGGPFLSKLAWINVSLGIFNLLPAFPMDGGRVLRAALATRLGRLRATAVAARVGQAAALGLGFMGLWVSPMLLLIALFVWMGAQQELVSVRLSAKLSKLEVADAMVRDFRVLEADWSLSQASQLSASGFQHDFLVTRRGSLSGALNRDTLARSLATLGPTAKVEDAMLTEVVTLAPEMQLSDALARMREQNAPAAAVMENGRLVGMLTAENVAERIAGLGAS